MVTATDVAIGDHILHVSTTGDFTNEAVLWHKRNPAPTQASTTLSNNVIRSG